MLLFAAVAAALTAAASALARPGGGGSYRGGGGGGAGHSGGGGGFGGGGRFGSGDRGFGFGGAAFPSGAGTYHEVRAQDLVRLLTFILVVAVAGGVVLLWTARRRLWLDERGPGLPFPASDAPMDAVRDSDALAPLRARDPGLTDQSIVDHIQPMAEVLRTAWCGGDLRAARALVSDGVYSRFQVQLALMRQENRRNVMGDARILAVTVEAVEDAPPLDVVHVRVTAEARDTEVPWGATDAQVFAALAGTGIQPYTEIWSLVRRTGAPSKPAGFAVGHACPSCGAPVVDGEMIRCRYCNALVCSGEHDWVLAEITQLVEWRPAAAVRPAGLDMLRARDPGIAREVLEDRASYLFWKWVQAGRAGSFAPLRKCATQRLLAGGARLDWTRGASDIAVGGADVLACEVGGQDGFDRVHVEISWSARFRDDQAHTSCKTVLRLLRKNGVTSKPSMTALVCQACGAPLVENDSTQCDYCGAQLNAGDQAWILEELEVG
jgi:inner membrane protein import complex subunit Tim44-like protein